MRLSTVWAEKIGGSFVEGTRVIVDGLGRIHRVSGAKKQGLHVVRGLSRNDGCSVAVFGVLFRFLLGRGRERLQLP